ncbi:MAG: hypothetical protein ABI846_00575 [Rudaea sp.]
MPLQNRVTPFGDIVAIEQRGLFTGNRGILHDVATKTLLKRRWSNKAWIICSLSDKGRWRAVMAQRSWTELFFLDEAVALAAGHRPCFACRRASAEAFRTAWAEAHGLPAPPSAPAMDAILHGERLDRRDKRIHGLPIPIARLPDGAVLVRRAVAFTIVNGRAHRWSAHGYGVAQTLSDADGLLTPPATLNVLRAGYRPRLHPTIDP